MAAVGDLDTDLSREISRGDLGGKADQSPRQCVWDGEAYVARASQRIPGITAQLHSTRWLLARSQGAHCQGDRKRNAKTTPARDLGKSRVFPGFET